MNGHEATVRTTELKNQHLTMHMAQFHLVTQEVIQSLLRFEDEQEVISELQYESSHKCSNSNCHFTALIKSLTPLESNDPGLALNFTVFRRARSFLSTLPSKEPCQSLTKDRKLNYSRWHYAELQKVLAEDMSQTLVL